MTYVNCSSTSLLRPTVWSGVIVMIIGRVDGILFKLCLMCFARVSMAAAVTPTRSHVEAIEIVSLNKGAYAVCEIYRRFGRFNQVFVARAQRDQDVD